MKLLYQLNAAFTALIVIVMSLTALFLYSMILNLLIEDEKRQLEDKGELLIELVNQQENPGKYTQLSQLLSDSEFRVLMFDRSQREILFSTLPEKTAADWASRYDQQLKEEDLWEGEGKDYVVYDITFTPRSNGVVLALATPLDDLQAVQTMFAWRMVVVLIIGLILAVSISYLLTRKLVTPLTRLKQELKKIEQRKFNDLKPVHASGEIKEVEQSIRQMAKELENYIHSQKQFFQNASHELKTPLMSIQGYAEGIKDGIFEGAAADKGLQVMASETERLKKIVDEMILLAKLDSDENIYHPEKTDLHELIKQASERVYPLAKEKQIELVYKELEPLFVNVDQEKMLQALLNILGNAIRHAEKQVSLTTELSRGYYTIKVSDDGCGIPEDLFPSLFKRFMKGKQGETGLGLAISRAIIERSNGTISAYNNKEQGATFVIHLPKYRTNGTD
ncbi:sensor histidine kinase [Thalassobacillus pellis]|uniref:sensor histidine kinase n=1 Tax=Thalassobacillus pellis TaxID=748008 RepID=UPI001960802B|nr:HAMP domain-containing sensor histidine kinase [Thalassobacillus pellis]MBM7551900.1 signal transduction histidine kinase [Thalassobacillus pellis]